MADAKVSAFTALGAAPATTDVLPIVDVSDTTQGAGGTAKKVTVAELFTSPTFVTPALGTPASGVATNLTGTASGLTAGTVTTNANLTGDVTSVGNAATVVKLNGTSLAGLSTGVLKNTTTTGVPFISKVALTEPATAATLTIADNQTLTVNGSATITNGTHSGTNTGDQTSIVGITGTKAQFDTAVSDGNIMFDGDSITNATATAHRVFYSDGSGVITELALGADGTFLKSNGAAVAPSFATPAGSGDVSKVGTPVNNQVGVWTGDGTLEGDASLTFDTTTDTLSVAASGKIAMGAVNIIDDTAGTTTLSNIDAIDATTEATIETAIDTLANLTSIQGRTVTLADAGANAIFGWDDTAGAYENLTASEALAATGVTASAAELNILDGATLTVTELNYVDGVTSAIQTQLDAKLALAGGTMTGNIQLGENASLDLDTAGSADGKYSGIAIAGTAGETLAFGDVIVLDVTAGKWFKGSVSAAAGADGDLRGGTGMCVLAAAGDASATKVLLMGTCRADANFPALTIGSVVYASTTGDITVTQPSTTDHIIKVLGYALTADEIMFIPSMNYITHT